MLNLPAYVEELRKDVRLLRIHNQQLQRSRIISAGKISELDLEIKRLRRENRELEKEKEKLEKEQERLKREIEKLTESNSILTKTTNRYKIALFDHGNFKNPDQKGKKKKGGQTGHADTNKDSLRDYNSFKRMRISALVCGSCGCSLTHTRGIKEKILIDIQINTQLLEVILESERQWCGNCKNEVRTTHPQSLPFTEYGINTFMVVMYLRFKGKQSVRTIAVTLSSLFGLPISKSGVLTLLSQAKEYLQGKYEELKKAIRKSEVMYNDETGWMVHGQKAWMWIMSTPDTKQTDGSITPGLTVYVAAESRGKGIFEEMYGDSKAKSMHDGYSSYESVTGEANSLYCWTHVLRFAFEETVKLLKEHLACNTRDRLVDLYQAIRFHTEWTKEQKEQALRKELDSILCIQSTDKTVNNILHRVKIQKEGLILALLLTEDGTNNLAEREFRELVQARSISFGSDTYQGMETTAILFSIFKTASRDKTRPLIQTLKTYLKEGVQKKYPQYKHSASFDT